MNPTEYYSLRITGFTNQLKEIRRRAALISIARLASFILFGLSLYIYFRNGMTGVLFASALFLFLFIFLIKRSVSLSAKKKLTGKLLFINQNEINVRNKGKNQFNDGSGITKQSMHSADLDIFGDYSVYHMLNRTTTVFGERALASLLNDPYIQPGQIREHQAAIAILSRQNELRQNLTARGLMNDIESENVGEIFDWLQTKERMSGRTWLQVMRLIMPVITVSGFFMFLSSGNPVVFGMGILVNILVLGKFAKYTSLQHLLIGKKETILDQYGAVLKTFEDCVPGNSSILGQLKSTSASAEKEILKLGKLSALFDQRLNLLVGIFINRIFLYDIQVMISLESWKKRNHQYFSGWIDAVGQIEQLNSLATFSFNHPDFCVPVVRDGKPFIQALAVAHPLIPGGEQVTNDITAGEFEKLLLITGSNMSGKSTFLRTLGVNLLIAQCGLPVCATEFAFTPMHILSSIRISDSLQENTSYFMAELKRLKAIIEYLSTGKPALVLIDEVLRGTNSEDKRFGSEELIRKLIGYNCLTLFASHDLSLSTLEKAYPDSVRNYCFESAIRSGELLFDYKLHKGVATNKNASFLMEKMGIIGIKPGS